MWGHHKEIRPSGRPIRGSANFLAFQLGETKSHTKLSRSEVAPEIANKEIPLFVGFSVYEPCYLTCYLRSKCCAADSRLIGVKDCGVYLLALLLNQPMLFIAFFIHADCIRGFHCQSFFDFRPVYPEGVSFVENETQGSRLPWASLCAAGKLSGGPFLLRNYGFET